jgi:rare lipoprotein A
MIRALIVITGAIALLFTVASKAKADNNPFSGARSISVTMTRDAPAEICIASQYGIGDGYHGKRTASGARFDTHATSPYTVAHKTKPFGTVLTITNLGNGRVIQAKVTDRGPFIKGRCVDLGRAGANALGMGGLARVRVE